MNSWTKIRRAMGGNDPRHWRVPGFVEMRLRGDHWRRAAFACGIGLGITGPLAAVLLAVAPLDEVGWAVLLSIGMVFAIGLLVFMYKDVVEITISLEDDGLRRKIKPFLVNRLGWRNRDEFWTYDSMGECGIVPADQLGRKYSMIVIVVPDQTLALFVPRKVDIKQVAAFLASQHRQVKALSQIPSEARPQPSVGRRGMITAAVMAGAGVLLSVMGGVARLAIHSDGGEVDTASVEAAVKAAPEGVAVREYQGVGKGGVNQARISPDGKWVWAFTKGKQHLVWNDQQAEPVGELEIPSSYEYHVAFTPDSQRLIVVAGLECHVWQLDPLQREQHFPLDRSPEHLAVTADGQRLIVATISDIRLYDLNTGQVGASMPITSGAIVDTGLSTDGNSLVVVQHSRILSVRLDNGAVEELVAYQGVHLNGTLAAGGKWAAVPDKQGAILYDLTARRRASTIASGTITTVPTISADGAWLAHATMYGVGVWDTKAKKAVTRFMLNKSTRLDLSDNGRYLLGFSYRSPKLLVWEMPK